MTNEEIDASRHAIRFDRVRLLIARRPPAPLVLRVTTARSVEYVGPFRTRVEAMVAKVDLEFRAPSRAMTIRVMSLPFYAKLTNREVHG